MRTALVLGLVLLVACGSSGDDDDATPAQGGASGSATGGSTSAGGTTSGKAGTSTGGGQAGSAGVSSSMGGAGSGMLAVGGAAGATAGSGPLGGSAGSATGGTGGASGSATTGGAGGSAAAGGAGGAAAGQGGTTAGGAGGGSGAAGSGGAPPSTCTNPVIVGSSDSTIKQWSRFTGKLNVFYFSIYKMVDMTDFTAVFTNPDVNKTLLPWPSSYGEVVSIPLPQNAYVSLKFTVPEGYLETQPATVYGRYAVGESNFSAAVTMTISTGCGDFSDPAAPGSTVLPACRVNAVGADDGLFWTRDPAKCGLVGGATYYLNIINADVSGITPGGGTARSTASKKCQSGVCSDPVANGPGSWSPPKK